MAQNPKYDNDMVNLGYLNKRLGQTEESINNNNNSILQLPKNYSTPPNPPYYKDSLLCYDNKIYRCNTTKLKGEFYWNDWTIVATDDTTISDFIKNTYELEKLEIQEQIDGKVQTYYQENDPAKEWTTDLDKGRHVGDYWYNTTNDTQWRYNQISTSSPIIYGWGQVNIPKSVFDTIDTKKSIYTEKPTSYKKDDLWIIEETLSDEDLPVGTEENPITKGDWVFSIADSETYNKEHWVKKDEDIKLSYLEQHYYTITEIDSSLEIVERNTESKITKATEEISLNVSQTYTTKEEHTSAINDFDEQIGTINETIIEHKETLSDLSVEVGEVSASVESVETRTEELTVDVNGVKESIIPTSSATGIDIHIEDASNNPLIELEIEGKSTQVTTSGKNLLSKDIINNKYISVNENGSYNLIVGTPTSDVYATGKGNVLPAGTYTFSSTQLMQGNVQIYLWNATDNNYDIQLNYYLDKITFTINDTKTMHVMFYIPANTNLVNQTFGLQIELGEVKTDWEEYGEMPSPQTPSEIKSVGTYNEETGKYGIEVEIVGKNIFDGEYETGYISIDTGQNVGTTRVRTKNYIPVSENTTYTISSGIASTRWGLFYDENKTYFRYILMTSNATQGTFTTPENARYLRWYDMSQTNLNEETQLEKNSVGTDYVPYEKKILSMELNTPLRSLPNGIKDIAYIKNNKLYVDRKVGSVVLNGSESWTATGTQYDGLFSCYITNTSMKRTPVFNDLMSNYFKCNDFETKEEGITKSQQPMNYDFLILRISENTASSLTEVKTWLSTHNTQIDYELAIPITEELGEIDMPSTFKGVNYISTIDELEPTINIEYVRNTPLSNYVEGQINKVMTIEERHYSELVIEDNSIKASVTEINSNLSDMTGDIHTVQETLTSQEKTLEVISTNIDKTTGEIREVTTINGYKFNKDGLNIYTNENSFNTLIDNEGTYYKDGDAIISETTKDGFMATNIKNKGGQEYCYDETNKVYEFVKERIEVDGEYGYATFYNGVN